MTNVEKEKLRFRRHYILSPKRIECPFQNNCIPLNNNYFLYVHIDLIVTQYSGKNSTLVLLGDIFDYNNPEKSNLDILKDLPDNDYMALLKSTDKYMGRFVLIYSTPNTLKLTHDVTACRKIFHCHIEGKTWCSSQSYLLALVLGLNKTKDPSKLSYYKSREFELANNANIGDTTCYDEISQLMPNFYLDAVNYKSVRFWPYKRIERLPLNEVADNCSKIIRGYIESLGNRYNLMIPVTGGKDSRLLVAASYNIRDRVFYYVNKENTLNETSTDIAVPRKLFRKLNLDFNVIDPYLKIDEDFEEVYYQNNEHASTKYFPLIYNYYKNYSDKVNLPGNFVASSLQHYGLFDRKLDGNILSYLNYVPGYKFAREYYNEWFEVNKPVCEAYNIEVLTLFYWEERLANWGTQVHTEKDIAQEDIVPFNSRLLIEYFLSVNQKYIEKPDYILIKKIIQKLWPELLKMPINPSYKSLLLSLLSTFRILKPVKKIKWLFQSRKIKKNLSIPLLISILIIAVLYIIQVRCHYRFKLNHNLMCRLHTLSQFNYISYIFKPQLLLNSILFLPFL